MKAKKKWLVALLAVMMTLTMMPSMVFAAENVAKIGTTEYPTLAAAIEEVGANETITILRNVDDAVGIKVDSGKNFTIDFAGYTYTLVGPGEGSKGTETNGFQLLKDSTITFKNGDIKIAPNADKIKRIIQNYANLTLENMTFYSAYQVGGEDYPLSFNNGAVVFKGDTSIVTTNPSVIAFDVCKFSSYPAASVTFDNSYVGSIGGKILYDSTNTDTHKLTINGNGEFVSINKTDNSPDTSSAITLTGGTFDTILAEADMQSDIIANVTSGAYDRTVIGKAAVDKAIQSLQKGDKIEFDVVPADTIITVPEGVNVINKTDQNITVNGNVVAAGDEITPEADKPVDPPAKPESSPATGDESSVALMAALLALAAVGMTGTVFARRRHQ